ncbi:VanZ family protein [Virgibacillus sp. DJP39]|uniref:VanZ family protein n=1 Tax=Virgibacillus sp. DJP39 TaxID=3409790 RepID=UPI003BB79440
MKKRLGFSLLIAQVLFVILLPVWVQLTSYLHSTVIVVIWFCLSFISLFIGCWLADIKLLIAARTFKLAIFAYGIALLILLFFRPNSSHNTINLIPLETIRFYLSGEVDLLIALYNIGANIGLFIPFGLYYRYIKFKPTFTEISLLTIGSISLIELLQFLTGRGSLDVDDLFLNVIGVTTGYIIYPVFKKVLVVRNNAQL